MAGDTVENTDYTAFIRRAIEGAGRRVAAGDPADLPELLALRDTVDAAVAHAVAGLRSGSGAYSWRDIAEVLGISKQAAMQRWPDAHGSRRPGGQPSRLR
jgi:hypothetical protein